MCNYILYSDHRRQLRLHASNSALASDASTSAASTSVASGSVTTPSSSIAASQNRRQRNL